MEDLRLVGISDDGSRLVVESGGGDRFGLPLDERMHAALRGDRARLGQLQISIESELRPREIQTRIRSGETAEEIAAKAGVPVDRVRRYEGPVLLERTVVAQNAQTVGVRRVTDSITTPLGDLVRSRLEGHQVADGSIDWDSWLHSDGRWLVRLAYSANGHDRAATWLYDPARRQVEPADDEARWLTEEERAAPQTPRARPQRLAAVPAEQPDAQVGQHDTVPLSARRRPRAVPDTAVDDTPADDASADGMPADDMPADDKPGVQRTRRATETAATRGERPADRPDEAAATDEPPTAPAIRPAARTTGRARTGKRATVPSWDEILFGGPKRDAD